MSCTTKGYLVTLIKEECCGECTQSSCECANLCYHMYTCDPLCYQYTNGHMCKHIHRVHSLRQQWLQTKQGDIQDSLGTEVEDIDISMDDPLEFAEHVRNPSTGKKRSVAHKIDKIFLLNTDPTIQLKTFQSCVKSLEEIITIENTSIHSVLPHINSLLHNAVLSCRAAMSSVTCEAPPKPFEGEMLPPNKSLEHQWRFKATSKAPGRKKSGLVLR